MLDVMKSTGGGRQNIAIGGSVADAFKRACKGRAVGRSMNDAANRLVRWFNRQQQFVQTAVTSDVDEGMESAYASALRSLADELSAEKNSGVIPLSPAISEMARDFAARENRDVMEWLQDLIESAEPMSPGQVFDKPIADVTPPPEDRLRGGKGAKGKAGTTL